MLPEKGVPVPLQHFIPPDARSAASHVGEFFRNSQSPVVRGSLTPHSLRTTWQVANRRVSLELIAPIGTSGPFGLIHCHRHKPQRFTRRMMNVMSAYR